MSPAFATNGKKKIPKPPSTRGVANRLNLMCVQRWLHKPQLQGALLYHHNASVVFALAKAGAELLAELGEVVDANIDWSARNATSTPLTLAHEVELTEAILRFELACRERGLQFIDEHDLAVARQLALARGTPFRCELLRLQVPYADDRHRRPVDIVNIPDRAFAVQDPAAGLHVYLYEHDRGTMVVGGKDTPLERKASFIKKQLGYFEWWRREQHVKHWGLPRFRLLTVTTADTRIASMLAAQRLVTGGSASGLMLYSTTQRLNQHGVFGPAWVSAKRDGVSLLDRED